MLHVSVTAATIFSEDKATYNSLQFYLHRIQLGLMQTIGSKFQCF